MKKFRACKRCRKLFKGPHICQKGLALRNVRINSRLSEETLCFTATIYLDGKKIGEAANRGQGGAHEYHFIEGGRQLFENAVKDWVATNNEDSFMADEILIGNLLEDFQDNKISKTNAKKGFPVSLKIYSGKYTTGDFTGYSKVYVMGLRSEKQIPETVSGVDKWKRLS